MVLFLDLMILMEFVLMSLICILLQLVTNFQGKNLAVVDNNVAGISKKYILDFTLTFSKLFYHFLHRCKWSEPPMNCLPTDDTEWIYNESLGYYQAKRGGIGKKYLIFDHRYPAHFISWTLCLLFNS